MATECLCKLAKLLADDELHLLLSVFGRNGAVSCGRRFAADLAMHVRQVNIGHIARSFCNHRQASQRLSLIGERSI